jgi:hypothetical protein
MELYRRAKQHAPAIAAKMRSELNRKLGAEIYYGGVLPIPPSRPSMRTSG